MKDTDGVSKENRELVRDFVANLRIQKPQGNQALYRIGLAKKIYTELDNLEGTHLLRLYEALAHVDFPVEEVSNLRDHISRRRATMHNLRAVRGVNIPPVTATPFAKK